MSGWVPLYILYIGSRFFSPDPWGNSNDYTVYLGYLIEYSGVILSACLFIEKRIYWNSLLLIIFFYYFTTILFTPFHVDFINLTVYHHAAKGLLYVFLAFSMLSNKKVHLDEVILHFAVILGVSQLVQVVSAISMKHLFTFGAMGSYAGLICLLGAYVFFKRTELLTLVRILGIIFFLFLAFVANSLNSILSFTAAMLIYYLLNARYLRLFIIFCIISFLFFWINSFENEAIIIANKSLNDIKTGSGRLLIYMHCIDFYISDKLPILGFGLLNESLIFRHSHPLENGPLTCHSSILSTISSYGFFGILYLAIIYLLLTVYLLRLSAYKNYISELSFLVLCSLFIFGFFSTFLPGAGSPLLSLAIFAWGRKKVLKYNII